MPGLFLGLSYALWLSVYGCVIEGWDLGDFVLYVYLICIAGMLASLLGYEGLWRKASLWHSGRMGGGASEA